MSQKLIAQIESMGKDGYLAYIDSIKGMVEHAGTPEDAIKELLISLKVKMAYDLKVDVSALKETVITPLEEYKLEQIRHKGKTEKEIDIDLMVA